MESADIDRIVAEVRSAADQSGALVIDAVLSAGDREVIAVAVNGDQFPSLIRHIKPKIVYLSVTAFDAAEELQGSFDNEDFFENPHAKKLIASWRFRDGQTCRAVLAAMHDGIIHGIIETTDWLEEFEEQVESLSSELQQLDDESKKQLQAEGQKKITIKVRQLMADPRFSASKVGIAKRTALAEALFPDTDRDTIRAIVERAEREHFLATPVK